MKLLKVTTEQRAYTEEQAKDIINKFVLMHRKKDILLARPDILTRKRKRRDR